MSLIFKIEKDEQVNVTEEGDGTPFSSDSTETIRTINDVILVQEGNSFDVGGDFTLEQLKQNKNKVFIYAVETNYHDSFRSEINHNIEFIEAFLTEEKAVNLQKAILIIEKAIEITKDANNKKFKEAAKEKLVSLSKELKDLNIDKDLTKDTKRNPLKMLNFLGENGAKRSIYISWGSSYSDIKYSDEIIERITIIPELKIEETVNLTTKKRKI